MSKINIDFDDWEDYDNEDDQKYFIFCYNNNLFLGYLFKSKYYDKYYLTINGTPSLTISINLISNIKKEINNNNIIRYEYNRTHINGNEHDTYKVTLFKYFNKDKINIIYDKNQIQDYFVNNNNIKYKFNINDFLLNSKDINNNTSILSGMISDNGRYYHQKKL